jgi:hypothetical protein
LADAATAGQGEGGVAPPEPPGPLDVAKAQAAVMDAHTREMEAKIHAADLELRQHSQGVEDQNRDEDRKDKLHEAAIGLAGDVIRAPTQGESGKQVNVGDAGKKASKIIKDADEGLT